MKISLKAACCCCLQEADETLDTGDAQLVHSHLAHHVTQQCAPFACSLPSRHRLQFLPDFAEEPVKMHLMYHLDENGTRVYTLKKAGPDGKPTNSAHPGMPPPSPTLAHAACC